METKKTTYRLYAMPLTAEFIAISAKERFSRVTPTPRPGYVLVFTDKAVPAKSVEITADKAKRLSDADVRWLRDSSTALLAEELEQHKPEILKSVSESMEALEKELRARKQKMTAKEE